MKFINELIWQLTIQVIKKVWAYNVDLLQIHPPFRIQFAMLHLDVFI